MLNRVKVFFVPLLLFAAFTGIGPAAVTLAQEETKKNLCSGANLKFSDPGDAARSCGTGGDPQKKVNDLVEQVVNIFSIIVGIAAVIMIIYGGFRFITSGGDSGNVTTAKQTVLYALVGLIIVALAQVVVKFILNKVA